MNRFDLDISGNDFGGWGGDEGDVRAFDDFEFGELFIKVHTSRSEVAQHHDVVIDSRFLQSGSNQIHRRGVIGRPLPVNEVTKRPHHGTVIRTWFLDEHSHRSCRKGHGDPVGRIQAFDESGSVLGVSLQSGSTIRFILQTGNDAVIDDHVDDS